MGRFLKGITVVVAVAVFIYWCITREDYQKTMQRHSKSALEDIDGMEGLLKANRPLSFVFGSPAADTLWRLAVMRQDTDSSKMQVPELMEVEHEDHWWQAMEILAVADGQIRRDERDQALQSLATAREHIQEFQGYLAELYA